MARESERAKPAEQQGDGQPENLRELQDRSGGAAQADRVESGMGGTSDAGSAADAAAEDAAFDRGLPDDRTLPNRGQR